ncbi:MAG: pyridoxamine 5'-phosphate oxidase [Verrucomicrobiales bacterium]|jgi:pyridoxamine 5'-phosphate oxidase
MDLSDRRTSYDAEGIDLASMADDPFAQFERWFANAQASTEPEPYAMVVSTVDAQGQPRGRNVLLRGVDERGFTFFTNYGSAKAEAIESTGVAALTFHWHSSHRQVHVEGRAVRVEDYESDTYFAKRPRDSQLGAWASAQSSVIESRDVLLDRLTEVTARFAGGDVPRPDFWGGYRVSPERVEFWQGQPNRLHDRVRYDRGEATWNRVILSS